MLYFSTLIPDYHAYRYVTNFHIFAIWQEKFHQSMWTCFLLCRLFKRVYLSMWNILTVMRTIIVHKKFWYHFTHFCFLKYRLKTKYNKYYLYSDLAVSAISNLASHTLELAAAILVTDSAFFAPFFPFFLLKKIYKSLLFVIQFLIQNQNNNCVCLGID